MSQYRDNRAVGIFGGRSINVMDDSSLLLAENIGRVLARRGWAVVTGGDDGIGGAACRGCSEEGGTTFAVLKESHLENCSDHVDWAVPTSFDLARSVTMNWMAAGHIALEGGFGTLFESALALDTGRPLVIAGDVRYLRIDLINSPMCTVLGPVDTNCAEAVVCELERLIELDRSTRKAPATSEWR